VLAVVLVGVIWKNFSAGGEKLTPRAEKDQPELTEAAAPAPAAAKAAASAPAATTAAANGITAGGTAAGGTSPFGEFAVDQNWPSPALGEVMNYDAFAAPDWAGPHAESPEDEALTEKRIAELMASKEAIIVMTGEKRIARIGKQEFQVGDRLGRYRISEITSQGVVLSER
jgi:hypothetical protein